MTPADPANLSSPYFLCQIATVVGGGRYTFTEAWLAGSTPAYATKSGGRTGGTTNPGVAVDGATFAVGDYALARSADGEGGAYWELYSLASSSKWKQPVRAAATGNVNLAAPGASMDGVTFAAGDSFLAPLQSTASQNGIYNWNGVAVAATRRSDADSQADLLGAIVLVTEGTVNHDSIWVCTNDPTITIGVTNITFERVYPACTGTDNRAVRMDGTRALQDSAVTIRDDGTTFGDGGFVASLGGSLTNSYTYILSQSGGGGAGTNYGQVGYTQQGGGNAIINFDVNNLHVDVVTNTALGAAFNFRLVTSDAVSAPAYEVMRNFVTYTGYEGTLAPGMPVRGGIITGAGSGTFGTVTNVSVVTANGVSGTVTNPSTTPAITITLGAITPTSVAATGALSGTTLTTSGNIATTGGTISASGNITTTGGQFTGSGAGLTSIPAGQLTGTLDLGTW